VVARRIDGAYDRVLALSAFQEQLLPERSIPLLQEALESALATETDLHHDELLASIAARIAGLSQEQAGGMWRTAASVLQSLACPELAAKLHALAPGLQRAEGERMVGESLTALTDVARWFP
jgi:hypothetical protein